MKSVKTSRPGYAGRSTERSQPPSTIQSAPRRPWPLISIGVSGFALVLFIGLNPGQRREVAPKAEQKVYSAATDAFEPMAVTSHQAGKLDEPGVANPLRLFAVKPGSNNREGVAVLGAAEDSSRTYLAGALLENGAQLKEIYADHVVLMRGVKSYKLYLPQKGKSDQLAHAGTKGLTIGGFPAPQPPLAPPPVRVSDAIRVAPFYDGTQIAGFSVYPGSRSGQFASWGLKSGDVLVSLGGQALTSFEEMESLLDQLAQGGTLTGEVRRGEERITVTLDGAPLMAAAHLAGAP